MQSYMYYYEHQYHEEEEATRGPSKRRQTLHMHRKFLPRDKRYYMNSLVMKMQDPEISVFKLGVSSEPPHYEIKNRCDNALYLHFVMEGAGSVDDRRYEGGEVCITLPMQTYTLKTDDENPWSMVWVMITGDYAEELKKALDVFSEETHVKFENPDNVRKLAEFFLYELQPSDEPVQYVKGMLQMLLSFATFDREASDADSKITLAMQRIIFKAKDEIYQKLSTCTVASIAEKVRLERKYFCKLFTAVTGVTPQNYILECKMNWVKNALVETDLSISEIVTKIGYTHRNGLLAAFKKQFGCSPSEYRKLYGQFKDQPI